MRKLSEKLAVLVALIVIELVLGASLFGQISIVSWNLCEFGGTKDELEMKAIVQAIRDHDIVCIQEVVAGDPAGVQKVAELADMLDRTGADWDYRYSDPTVSPSPYIAERYAFLWKTSRTKIKGRAVLLQELSDVIHREPFVATFIYQGKEFNIINYHSRSYKKNPEEELEYIIDYMLARDEQKWILAGDFNLFDDHEVLDELYGAGYVATLRDVPTTLKRSCDQGSYTNHPIDNIFFRTSAFRKLDGGIIDLVGDCSRLDLVRSISDHLGVYVKFE